MSFLKALHNLRGQLATFFSRRAAMKSLENPSSFYHEQPCIDVSLNKLAEIAGPVASPKQQDILNGWKKLSDAVNFAFTIADRKEHKTERAYFHQIGAHIADVANRIERAAQNECASVSLRVDCMAFLERYGNGHLKRAYDYLSLYKYDPKKTPNMKLHPTAQDMNTHIETLENAVIAFRKAFLDTVDCDAFSLPAIGLEC